MKRILPAVLVFALAACGGPTDQGVSGEGKGKPKKGEAAPRLVLNKFLRGDLKAVKGWEDLKGKSVVLEFWGTFCDPCVENIPHMNELAEKFRDKPVVFISLSKEKAGTVEAFLKEHEMKGNIAAEASEAFRNFRVRGIPHTVLVDKEGMIRGFSYPSEVTPATIEDLLAGRPVKGFSGDGPGTGSEEAKTGEQGGAGSLAFFSAVPVEGSPKKTRSSVSDTGISIQGKKLEDELKTLLSPAQLVEYRGVDNSLLGGRYDITCSIARVPGSDNRARLRAMAIAGIGGAFPVAVKISRAKRKVLLLKKLPGSAGPAPAKKRGSMSWSTEGSEFSVSCDGYGMSQLGGLLQDWMGRPVLDETGLDGLRTYEIKTSERGLWEMNGVLAGIGLVLEEGSREIEVATVSAIKG